MITMPTSVLPTEVDKRSFGESHASELSRVSSFRDSAKVDHAAAPAAAGPAAGTPGATPAAPTTAPTTSGSTAASPAPSKPHPVATPNTHSPSSGAVDPAQLNNSPAPIPAPVSSVSPGVAPGKIETSAVTSPESHSELHATSVAPPGPTVAEAGIPVTSTGGGPASGSLIKEALHGPSSSTVPAYDQLPSSSAPGWGVGGFRSDVRENESAEDEKKRLEREERERILAANTTAYSAPTGQPAPYESAEEEKKRLEREEREKLLRGDGPSGQPGDKPPPPSGPPPSYS